MAPRRKLHERLRRDFSLGKEGKDRWDLLKRARIWHDMWEIAVEEFPTHEGWIQSAMLRVKKKITRFCILEAGELPSRVLYRRVMLLDDMAIRAVTNAMTRADRASLRDEAKASVKNHGGPKSAHKARIIRDRYGIPRF